MTAPDDLTHFTLPVRTYSHVEISSILLNLYEPNITFSLRLRLVRDRSRERMRKAENARDQPGARETSREGAPVRERARVLPRARESESFSPNKRVRTLSKCHIFLARD